VRRTKNQRWDLFGGHAENAGAFFGNAMDGGKMQEKAEDSPRRHEDHEEEQIPGVEPNRLAAKLLPSPLVAGKRLRERLITRCRTKTTRNRSKIFALDLLRDLRVFVVNLESFDRGESLVN
jgi:hypothetical protein